MLEECIEQKTPLPSINICRTSLWRRAGTSCDNKCSIRKWTRVYGCPTSCWPSPPRKRCGLKSATTPADISSANPSSNAWRNKCRRVIGNSTSHESRRSPCGNGEAKCRWATWAGPFGPAAASPISSLHCRDSWPATSSQIVQALQAARKKGRAIIFASGAHDQDGPRPDRHRPDGTGLHYAPRLQRASVVHDLELARFGATSEDVAAN